MKVQETNWNIVAGDFCHGSIRLVFLRPVVQVFPDRTLSAEWARMNRVHNEELSIRHS